MSRRDLLPMAHMMEKDVCNRDKKASTGSAALVVV